MLARVGMMQSLDRYAAGVESDIIPRPGDHLYRHFSNYVRDLSGTPYGRRMYEVICYWGDDYPDWHGRPCGIARLPDREDTSRGWLMLNLRAQVERFYQEIWNDRDRSAIPAVLHDDFTFRGSLGMEKRDPDGFAEYVERVHAALDDYRCIIEDTVVEPPKVFARMTFQGTHAHEFLGHAPTGKAVRWAGAALFTFESGKVRDLWVLGDLKGLESALQQNET